VFQGAVYLMGNAANEWAKQRKPDLIRLVSPNKLGCQHKGCGEQRHSHLQFAHIKETPISRTGPRGRKEKFADINAHPEAYKVKCDKHALTDKNTKTHDARMRRLGKR
jgi:hypothetical protein